MDEIESISYIWSAYILSHATMGSNSCMCCMQLKINCIRQLKMTRFLLAIEEKFDSKFELCWSMGYNIHSKAYMSFDPRTKKILYL
jgi:hypothetical protein